MTTNITQQSLWKQVWDELNNACRGNEHRFATPALANLDASGHLRQRTVVLRKADPAAGELHFYTDRRSPKARAVNMGLPFGWLFWDPASQLQIRATGIPRWADSELAAERYASLPKHSRKAYATLSAPGTKKDEAGDGLPDNWVQRTLDDTDYARENFGIVITHLNEVEILRLDREGNLRLLAHRSTADWSFGWIVP